MTRPKFVAVQPTTLKYSISNTETLEITLSKLVDINGNDIDMADFGDFAYCGIGPKTDEEEIIKFTGFTRNADGSVLLSGVTRNHLPQSPYTSTGTGEEHGAGTVVVFGDHPQIYEAILDYIDGIALSGSPDASLTAKGIVEIATTAEIDADEDFGSTGAPVAVRPDQLAASKYGTRLPSVDEKAGIVGLSATNTPITSNNVTQGSQSTDTQTTSTDTFNVGEASTTTNQNRLAQKFTATKDAYRGVTLNKKADTGTFTGTVTVSLQADSAGNPSGSALATATITNSQWLLFSAGDVDITFATEYTSVTKGSSYWIVIQTSTSDTSNHPNFGGRSSGGTGNAKYYNATDGWVQFTNSDLYYKTWEGNINKIVKTGSDGKIAKNLIGQSTRSGITTKALSDATGLVSTIPHGLGRTPIRVRLTALLVISTSVEVISHGAYTASGNTSIAIFSNPSSAQNSLTSTTYAILLTQTSNFVDAQKGIVTVDENNIYITWTKDNNPATGTAQILWEAE